MGNYMRIRRVLSLLLCASALPWFTAELVAAEETAVVTEGKINVRGKPGFIGEVITQLDRGEKVTILERINLDKTKPGEPTNWARIKLPKNTPGWVFAPFVKEGKVAATRLNLRAGPGENYSVIGRLSRGDAVKAIRTVEEWMEIESPEDSFAFIDLTLVRFGGTNAPTVPAVSTPAVATATPATTPPPTVIEPAASTTTTNVPASATVAAVPSPAETTEKAPETPVPAEAVRAETTATPAQVPPVTIESAAPATNPPAQAQSTTATTPAESLPLLAPKKSPEAAKRIVRREGVVRATKSIQAPTWYELVNASTGKTINYLYEEKLGVKLKDYRGQKVVVSGEEAIDPRWPNTPILDLETLDVLP